jgi:hypothetical protein
VSASFRPAQILVGNFLGNLGMAGTDGQPFVANGSRRDFRSFPGRPFRLFFKNLYPPCEFDSRADWPDTPSRIIGFPREESGPPPNRRRISAGTEIWPWAVSLDLAIAMCGRHGGDAGHSALGARLVAMSTPKKNQ